MRSIMCALVVLVVASSGSAAAGDTLKQTHAREVMPNGYRGELAAQARRDLTRLRVTRAASTKVGAAHTLAQQARHLAAHGGIRSSRYGDATPRMRQLVRRLIIARFRPAGPEAVRRALCISRRESGDSPGAISATHDYGVSQIHVASHPEYDAHRLVTDPVYSVNAFWKLSKHGRDFGPWQAGARWAC